MNLSGNSLYIPFVISYPLSLEIKKEESIAEQVPELTESAWIEPDKYKWSPKEYGSFSTSEFKAAFWFMLEKIQIAVLIIHQLFYIEKLAILTIFFEYLVLKYQN